MVAYHLGILDISEVPEESDTQLLAASCDVPNLAIAEITHTEQRFWTSVRGRMDEKAIHFSSVYAEAPEVTLNPPQWK